MNADAARILIESAVAAIPEGAVSSYGEVASRAGLPKRARLVARVLAQLPAGSALPWHRVLRAGGRIAFAPDSADFERQKARLIAEGCAVSASGRVSPANTAHSLDAQLWAGLFRET